ncbi:tripartite tricarboxylate transporter substrate binding protein [Roseococcus sp. YIM B11640]|uniref:tripartite tricarboxylate transporter substrate binding protein n=1 Tax=Roseococcus sp. YIM B11640 TaxID=3133973 RepID=UPI003C7D5443
MRRRSLLLLTGGGLAAPRIGRANWPASRSIEIIVPAPSASAWDHLGRLVAQHLSRQIPGARCVAMNRPGAGGQIGFETLFLAPADGFTIGLVATPTLHAISLERATRYDPEDFTFLANIVDDPGGFWVRADSPWTSLADLQQAARGRPSEIGVGTSGIGSDDHLLLLAFEAASGVNLLHVPYASTGPIQRDVLARTLVVGAFNSSEALPLLRARRIRGLAQGGRRRWAAAAEVPTFQEAGFDVLGGSAQGLAAPPGLPPEIALQFELALKDMLTDEEFRREAENLRLPLQPLFGREYRRHLAAEYAARRALWERRPWRE